MKQNFLRPLIALSLVCIFGCDDGTNAVTLDYRTSTVEDGLFFVPRTPAAEADHVDALVLDVSTDDAKLSSFALPGGDVTAVQRPGTDGREVVVLTSGRPAVLKGKDKHPSEPSHVLVFGRTGELQRIALKSRYAGLALSPDGKYGIAFQSSKGLSLLNSVEVIDFSAKVSTFVDLSLDGRIPTGYVFAPVGKFARRLAVAPLPNALQVLDLEHPERGPISITLDSSLSLNPVQFEFAGNRVFVRSAGASRIVSFQMIEVPKGNHPWQFAPGVHDATDQVRDIAVTGEGTKQRLLALTGSLEVFDPDVGPTAKIDGLAAFSQILQFIGTSPIDKNPLPRAMLYGASGSAGTRAAGASSQVGFVDLGDESAWATRNIEIVELGDAVLQLRPLATKTAALASHGSALASVIDLEARKVRRVVLNEFSGSLLLDETSAHRRLWARGSFGEQLGVIDLDSFVGTEVPVAFGPLASSYGGEDRPPTAPFEASQDSMLLVPSATRRRIAVMQSARTGHVTFVDADAPTAETALEVVGTFLPEILD
jgi:hypothetical protein